jgi:hypothetical protein
VRRHHTRPGNNDSGRSFGWMTRWKQHRIFLNADICDSLKNYCVPSQMNRANGSL